MIRLKIASYCVAAIACAVLVFSASRGSTVAVLVDGTVLRVRDSLSALQAASDLLGVPVEALVLRTRQLHPPRTLHYHAAMPERPFSPGRHVVLLRPLRGDHYHQRVVFKINGKELDPWHDVASIRGVPWENRSSCVDRFAYHSARGLHVGFHTHCDGVAHSHPWTAPHALSEVVGGAGHHTGLLLDAMGVECGPRQPQLQLPNRSTPLNGTHSWRLVVCSEGQTLLRVREHLDRLWYPVHGVSLVFSYGRTHETACELDAVQLPESHGFDEYPYPDLVFAV